MDGRDVVELSGVAGLVWGHMVVLMATGWWCGGGGSGDMR